MKFLSLFLTLLVLTGCATTPADTTETPASATTEVSTPTVSPETPENTVEDINNTDDIPDIVDIFDIDSLDDLDDITDVFKIDDLKDLDDTLGLGLLDSMEAPKFTIDFDFSEKAEMGILNGEADFIFDVVFTGTPKDADTLVGKSFYDEYDEVVSLGQKEFTYNPTEGASVVIENIKLDNEALAAITDENFDVTIDFAPMRFMSDDAPFFSALSIVGTIDELKNTEQNVVVDFIKPFGGTMSLTEALSAMAEIESLNADVTPSVTDIIVDDINACTISQYNTTSTNVFCFDGGFVSQDATFYFEDNTMVAASVLLQDFNASPANLDEFEEDDTDEKEFLVLFTDGSEYDLLSIMDKNGDLVLVDDSDIDQIDMLIKALQQ
jgi:hypothetical protein